MSDYGYRIKDGRIRLVDSEDFDLPKPTTEQLAAYRADVQERMPLLQGFVTKLTPDHVLEQLIREGAGRTLYGNRPKGVAERPQKDSPLRL